MFTEYEYQCLGCPYTDTCDTLGCIRLLNYHKSLMENQEQNNNSYEQFCCSDTML